MADELLRWVAELDEGDGVALTRLAKRLDERVSVLLRRCTALTNATVGGAAGPGWVELHCDQAGRWVVRVTPAGRAACGGS